MSTIHSRVRANSYLYLRLPSESLKLVEVTPNTIVDLGKFGSFPSNLLIGRPYHSTYELLDKQDGEEFSRLELILPVELNADLVTQDAISSGNETDVVEGSSLLQHGESMLLKNNRLTVDDASRQVLTQQEIEELKKSVGSKEIIEQILANHTGLDEKTAFARAKYTLRKTRKYVKRLCVLPLTMDNLIEYVLEKEPSRILELRGETLGLICSWSNVHRTDQLSPALNSSGNRVGGSRWLVADETGGLVTAALAERLGILLPEGDEKSRCASTNTTSNQLPLHSHEPSDNIDITATETETEATTLDSESKSSTKIFKHRDFPIPARTNTLTVLHPAVQPNLSLLKYFGYDANQPDVTHPLHDHMKSLSYLQLLHPEEDPLYQEPEPISEAILQTWKSGKRGTYFKKRRRWERCKSIIDETREGGFDGLVVASNMDPATILPYTIPLVRGGGSIVVYSPTIEPLVKLKDLYSRERRLAYVQHLARDEVPNAADFPVDPRLLLAPTVQTSRIREWQVLPGRTHPLMTSRGGSEGFVFTARRVLPLKGGVEARGNTAVRKRKAGDDNGSTVSMDMRQITA